MTTAADDLLTTFGEILKIARTLNVSSLNAANSRSGDAIAFAGLKVIAFSALEDFLRRRVIEVLTVFGKHGLCFEDLPHSARLHLLSQTIAGLNFNIGFADEGDKLTLVQLQGLLLGEAADPKVKYQPSEYVFGRSSSNISMGAINDILTALTLKKESLATAFSLTAGAHVGDPTSVFKRFSTNRHKAAHTFSRDFDLSTFISDVSSIGLMFAFAFDSCISQATHRYIHYLAAHTKPPAVGFMDADLKFKKLTFRVLPKSWGVEDLGGKWRPLKGGYDQYLTSAVQHQPTTGASILALDGPGNLIFWSQPV